MSMDQLTTMQLGNIICDALATQSRFNTKERMRRNERAERALLELVDRARQGEIRRRKSIGKVA